MPTTPKVVTFTIIKSRKSYTTTQKVGTRLPCPLPDPNGVAQPHTKPPPHIMCEMAVKIYKRNPTS